MTRPAARPTGFALAILLAGVACSPCAMLAEGPILLRDVTKQSGVTFRHTHGGGGRYYLEIGRAHV